MGPILLISGKQSWIGKVLRLSVRFCKKENIKKMNQKSLAPKPSLSS